MDAALAAEKALLSQQKPFMDAMEQALEAGDSEIQQFYANAVVFVTGGSGFLGKLLVEKLFRSCNLKKMFLLIRSKKGKSGGERLTEILNDTVFDTVRKTKPDFAKRIYFISGDISELRLGISDEDWTTLRDEVDIIFHLAATTRFDESLKTSTLINVRGARETIELGKECKNLRSFVHVSTGYANSTSDRRGQAVLDQFYPGPVSPSALIQLAETVDEDRLRNITPEFTKNWSNTYTFTKAVAEDVVRIYGEDLPICIVRPSIVVATYREPTPGWLDMSCSYSGSGLILGSALGIMRVVPCDKEKIFSLVPGDIVNNATIAAGWRTGVKERVKRSEINIYTVSSAGNPITCGELVNSMWSIGIKLPTPKAVWAISLLTTKSYTLFTILTYLLHVIPALILDGICLLVGKKTMFRKIYEKVHRMLILLSTFTLNDWYFNVHSLAPISERMSEADKKIFNFDMNTLNWNDFILIWCIGIRKYIIKDGLKDTEYARKKQNWLKMANYCVTFIYFFCLWKLITCIFNVFVL